MLDVEGRATQHSVLDALGGLLSDAARDDPRRLRGGSGEFRVIGAANEAQPPWKQRVP
jgi:hypothetical protein